MTWHEGYLVLGVFLGVVGTFSAILITYHFQKKQFHRDGLLRVFDLLSNEKNKEIRRKVYEAYCTKKISPNGEILDDSYRLEIEEARTIFGQIGRLVKEGHIPKNAFLDTFAGVIIRVWKSLEQNIKRERKLRETVRYMENFEELFNDAIKHWEKHYKDDPEPDPCSEKTKEVIRKRS